MDERGLHEMNFSKYTYHLKISAILSGTLRYIRTEDSNLGVARLNVKSLYNILITV